MVSSTKVCRRGHERPADGPKSCPACNRERMSLVRAVNSAQNSRSEGVEIGDKVPDDLAHIFRTKHHKSGRLAKFTWTEDTAQLWWKQASGEEKWSAIYVKGMSRRMGWPEFYITESGPAWRNNG